MTFEKQRHPCLWGFNCLHGAPHSSPFSFGERSVEIRSNTIGLGRVSEGEIIWNWRGNRNCLVQPNRQRETAVSSGALAGVGLVGSRLVVAVKRSQREGRSIRVHITASQLMAGFVTVVRHRWPLQSVHHWVSVTQLGTDNRFAFRQRRVRTYSEMRRFHVGTVFHAVEEFSRTNNIRWRVA